MAASVTEAMYNDAKVNSYNGHYHLFLEKLHAHSGNICWKKIETSCNPSLEIFWLSLVINWVLLFFIEKNVPLKWLLLSLPNCHFKKKIVPLKSQVPFE